MAVGKESRADPRSPTGVGTDWEQPEGPGNILATSDYVIVAGARSVNIYTDLTLAKAKLDRELAAAPEDPKPRLRYAEVMFVSGDPDVALTKLDEAAALLGGLKSLETGPDRDRFFRDSLTFADRLSRTGADEDRQRAAKLFDRAGAAGGDAGAAGPLSPSRGPVRRAHQGLHRRGAALSGDPGRCKDALGADGGG